MFLPPIVELLRRIELLYWISLFPAQMISLNLVMSVKKVILLMNLFSDAVLLFLPGLPNLMMKVFWLIL